MKKKHVRSAWVPTREQHLLRRRLISGGHFVAHTKKSARRRERLTINSFAQLHGDNRCTPYLVDRNTGSAAEKDEASNLCRGNRTFLQRLASRVPFPRRDFAKAIPVFEFALIRRRPGVRPAQVGQGAM